MASGSVARAPRTTPACKGNGNGNGKGKDKGIATCMLLDYAPEDDNVSVSQCSDNTDKDPLELEHVCLGLGDDVLTVGGQIGQGRFKNVYAGRHKQHGPVAVLRIPSDNKRNEVRMLALLAKMDNSFLFIPEVFGARQDPSGDLIVAQELSMLGSLRSVLQDADLAPMLTPQHRLVVAAQLAGAIGFLEAARIVHTDIACRNVLLFQLEEDAPEVTSAKLTDFGFAICLPPDADHVIHRHPQATRWCAPETVMSNKWSDKTDVWSLGIALWELFSGGATPWMSLSKRSEVAQQLRELAPDESHSEATMTRRTPRSCPQRELTKRLREFSCRDIISEAFPAPEEGVYPSVAHTTVLSCLRVDPVMRMPASSVAPVFLDIVHPPASPMAKSMAEEYGASDDESTRAPSEVDVPVPAATAATPTCIDTLIPLEPRGGATWAASNAPVQTGKWTIWTYVNPALRRQDFACESDARDALSCGTENARADLGYTPRILRDPAGCPISGTCWTGTRTLTRCASKQSLCFA